MNRKTESKCDCEYSVINIVEMQERSDTTNDEKKTNKQNKINNNSGVYEPSNIIAQYTKLQ